MKRSAALFSSACLAVAGLGGCAAAGSSAPFRAPGALGSGFAASAFGLTGAVKTPALVGVTQNGQLGYFPMSSKGGTKPQKIVKLPGVSYANAMVSNGQVLAIVNQAPPGLIAYDLSTNKKKTYADPYGTPLDVTIDKNANIYVLNYESSNSGNVAMYPAGEAKAKLLACAYIGAGQAIAADNEGDLFINGYAKKFVGVVEIPGGPKGPQPQNCKKLALLPERGLIAGIGVDPNTDDLIVLDNPGKCYGSKDGRMTIYSKPYKKTSGHSIDLNGTCVLQMRLNSTSTTLFATDVSAGTLDVIARSYPSGGTMGSYANGNFIGITTLPNTLPN